MNVSVPASFFVKTAKRDYYSPANAFVREFIQNSRDAGATKIDLSIFDDGCDVVFVCADDGCGMTEDIINNKLMALGETTKDGASTGGFGVAKILIYFSQSKYTITTNDLMVEGSGSNYKITKKNKEKGTISRVVLNKEVIPFEASRLASIFAYEIENSDIKPTITINGNIVSANKKRGRLNTDLGDVRVYKKKSDKVMGTYSVRVNGLHMFSEYCADLRHEIIVELAKSSVDLLTSNRDSFRGDLRSKINAHIQALALNSTLTNESSVRLFKGEMSRVSEAAFMDAIQAANRTRDGGGNVHEAISAMLPGDVVNSILSVASERQINEDDMKRIYNDYIKYNYYVETTGYKKLPVKWNPSRLKSKNKRLLDLWALVVAEVIKVSELGSVSFDVGFTISSDDPENIVALAKYSNIDNKHVFLLNPEHYGSDNKMPRLSSADMMHYLISLATHEVTHALGYSLHNEAFVAAELELRRKVMLGLPGLCRKMRTFTARGCCLGSTAK